MTKPEIQTGRSGFRSAYLRVMQDRCVHAQPGKGEKDEPLQPPNEPTQNYEYYEYCEYCGRGACNRPRCTRRTTLSVSPADRQPARRAERRPRLYAATVAALSSCRDSQTNAEEPAFPQTFLWGVRGESGARRATSRRGISRATFARRSPDVRPTFGFFLFRA